MFPNGASAYRKTQVTTANPAQLVVQLYEGAVCFLERAIQAMDRSDVEGAHTSLIRAQAVVTELRGTLRRDTGPLAVQMDGLYDYFYRQLMLANVRKDPTIASEVLGHVRVLLSAWRAIASPRWTTPAGPSAALAGRETR